MIRFLGIGLSYLIDNKNNKVVYGMNRIRINKDIAQNNIFMKGVQFEY